MEGGEGTFEIPNKRASIESLERWRKLALVRNAARRFRYTSDLRKRREQLEAKKQFRVVILTAKAALLFVGDRIVDIGTTESKQDAMEHGFNIDYETLSYMIGKHAIFERLGKADGIAKKLGVSLEDGIDGSEEDTKRRAEVYGRNVYKERPPRGFWIFVWEALHDSTLILLIVCALVSLAVGIPEEGLSEGWYDGCGILLSIFLVVFITAFNDYKQSLQFQSLDKEKKKVFVEVCRGGRRQKVLTYDLVVGDIVHLSIGSIVPADGIYVSGYSLAIDESSLTGESELVYPSLKRPFLLGGSAVRDGSAKMLVTAVGMNSEWGRVMSSLVENEDEETPLQVKLSGVATLVGKIGMVFAAVTFIALIARFAISKSSLWQWYFSDLYQILSFFAIAVTIVVVAVPEGLPLAVTLSLAYAMKQMMKDKALVRRLSACETMGSATCICSDKTGTLTTNKMVVVKLCIGSGEVHGTNNVGFSLPSVDLRDALVSSIFLNTSGFVDETDANNPDFLGSSTEVALLRFGYQLGGHFQETRSGVEIVGVEPFNSDKKRMGVIVKMSDNNYRACVKGASEIVLKLCDSFMDTDGKITALDGASRSSLYEAIAFLSSEALRTLCIAFKNMSSLLSDGNTLPSGGFTCIGIIGIKDPLRPGVPDAVQLCIRAGIKVRMVTGDGLETAKAIARECNILKGNGFAVEGHVFREWTEAERRAKIPKLQVLARSLPNDKLILVKTLKEMGEVVAVTGDGTNDAPALHASDIGLSMGICGTEVAKESSDVVILDDNFVSVVNVVKWGRSVYTNIQKFVQFQLTVNLVALVINFTSACITGKAPLSVVQLLWVNLIMDTLGALALATEPPYDELMEKPPVGRRPNLVTNVMWRNIFSQASYQLVVLTVLQYKGRTFMPFMKTSSDEELHTLIFNTFVFCQIFNELNCTEMERLNIYKHIWNNKIFISVIISTVLFQIVMVEFLGKVANTVPLNKEAWIISVAIGSLSIIVACIVKFIPVPSQPLFSLLKLKSSPTPDSDIETPLLSESK